VIRNKEFAMRPGSIIAVPQCLSYVGLTREMKHHGLCGALGVVLALAVVATAAQAQTFEVLYNLAGGTDGANPYAALIEVKGQFYGTTSTGGSVSCDIRSGCGTVFQLTPPAALGGPWTETVIYRFQGGSNDGASPQEALVADPSGNLYGTTSAGGLKGCSGGCGTVFELLPPSLPGGAWTEEVLYKFKGVPSGQGNGDAASPEGIVFGKNGDLFGVAYGGGYCTTDETGTYCYGAVYKLTAPARSGDPWTENVLYRFGPPNWGYGAPVFDKAGNLYTTAGWGKYGYGMILTLRPSADRAPWMGSAVYSFHGGGGGGDDGAFPCPGLVFDESGRLYGTTLGGGVNQPGAGTVFLLTPPAKSGGAWTESVLYAFTGGNDGYSPGYGPVLGNSGILYGTTSEGGSGLLGSVFELNADGQETTLLIFTPSDGGNPSGLLRDTEGNLYGTTQTGGDGNVGTIFKLTP
jgi:uncharacterized repeat protein (TIGR03803 family)